MNLYLYIMTIKLFFFLIESKYCDISIGPSLLVPIPDSFSEAKSWFNNIWKTSLQPLIQKAAQDTTFIPQDVQIWDVSDIFYCLN